jgi:hypothetical protein
MKGGLIRLRIGRGPSEAFKPLIAGDNIEMNGHPVREQQSLTAFAVVGLEIPPTSFAVVNPQGAPFQREPRKPMIISFAERTLGTTIAPTCGTTAATKETSAIRLDPHELRHARRRSARVTVVAKPAFFVARNRQDHYFCPEIFTQYIEVQADLRSDGSVESRIHSQRLVPLLRC